MNTALIVLASGTSSRFEGGNKLLADLQGKRIACHVIDNLSSIDFKTRYAVMADKSIETLFKTAGYKCILNLKPENGQGQSLALGAKIAIEDGYQNVCVVLADMPFVKPSHIIELLGTNASIVMSENNGMYMPPAVFRGKALAHLTEATGDKGAKGTFDMQDIMTIALSDLAACDIDTLEDLEKAQ